MELWSPEIFFSPNKTQIHKTNGRKENLTSYLLLH